PGSTHTITIRGMGDTSNATNVNQTAFIGEVRVTSVDRIFEDGMPGGGEATGQPLGQNMQRTMNVEASWAKAFGLEQLSYEIGWSLGGDDGGSWVQLKAKYGDSRTAGVQAKFMDMFHLAGSAVNVFGTYAQWPSWADYYAEQGLLNVGQYPIVQGIDDRASHLPPEPNNGVLIPATLVPTTASITDRADGSLGRITAAGGWITWNVIAPRSGQYEIALTPLITNENAVLLVNDKPVGDSGDSTGTVFLTKGLHSVKVRSKSSSVFQVKQITLAGQGAPASPALLSVGDGNGEATVSWTATTGATNYQVRFGTVPGVYSQVISAGTATSLTIRGLTNNLQYFFIVLAENGSGLSLPSKEKGVIPLGPGQTGSLAVWEFAGSTGNESSAAAASASARLTATALKRGTGLNASQSDWAAGMRVNRFASEPAGSAGNSYGTDLAQAITKKQYYEFTLQPVAGQRVSLSQLAFRAFFQNGSGGAGITYSTNGTTFSSGLPATGSPANGTTPWTVDLTGQAVLQNTTLPIIVRVYLYGLGAYQVSALGDTAGSDVVVLGSLSPAQVPLSITLASPASVVLSWPTNGVNYGVESQGVLDSSTPWNAVDQSPELDGNHWVLPLPFGNSNRFFRLSPGTNQDAD
ncbi:MAG TPA: fibronectin type III domain-containing protein, partial [Clostridia bacterium]|nr:fibronectin type III domain-containing protein [Clostridia bacterium]